MFISGAVVMMLELTGSRIIAPYLGTSTFIWTSLIGIILASLSGGYYYGGIYADKYPETKRLGHILMGAGLGILVVGLISQMVLSIVQVYVINIRIASVLAASILFGLPGFLLGMVSPMAVRLRLKDVNTSGSTIGRLYALSSVGSIVGTFLVGFYLLGLIGSRNTLFLLSGVMLLISMPFYRSKDSYLMLALVVIAPFILSFGDKDNSVRRYETEYNAVTIMDLDSYATSKKPVRLMKLANEHSSAMYLHGDSLVFNVMRFYELAMHFNPGLKNTIMIGGAGYNVPTYYQKKYSNVNMDIVEIDPGLTKLAIKEFRFKPSNKVKAIHADGRIYLNRKNKEYDAIFMDAYKSLYSIPFHLVSKEAMKAVANNLTKDGFMQANVISAINGPNSSLLLSVIATAKTVFPVVKLFKVSPAQRPLDAVQNVMIVAFKSEPNYSERSSNPCLQSYLDTEIDLEKLPYKDALILTDDFAPVEHFGERMISAYYKR